MTLDAQIESVLFWKGEPMSEKKLAEILKKTEEEIRIAIAELETKFEGRGVQLIRKGHEIMIGTRSEMGPLIEALIKEDLMRDLGKAGLETLSIILYRGPVSRRDIDYIRGVNSQFVLRNLLVRGLIEKVPHPDDQRTFLYKPTFELLGYLGISSLEQLPEFDDVRKEINVHEQKQNEEHHSSEVAPLENNG